MSLILVHIQFKVSSGPGMGSSSKVLFQMPVQASISQKFLPLLCASCVRLKQAILVIASQVLFPSEQRGWGFFCQYFPKLHLRVNAHYVLGYSFLGQEDNLFVNLNKLFVYQFIENLICSFCITMYFTQNNTIEFSTWFWATCLSYKVVRQQQKSPLY